MTKKCNFTRLDPPHKPRKLGPRGMREIVARLKAKQALRELLQKPLCEP